MNVNDKTGLPGGWYTKYDFNYGSVRALAVREPEFSNSISHFDGVVIFATKKEAEEAFKKNLVHHVESILQSTKHLVTNEALIKRLKKYKAKNALDALDMLRSILSSIPDKIE